MSFADIRQVQGDGPRLGPSELLREPPDVVKGDRSAVTLLAVVRPTGRVHHGADRARPQPGPDRGAGDLGVVWARARVEGDPGGQRQGERGPAGGERRVRSAAEHPAGRGRGQQLHCRDVCDQEADGQVPGGPAGHRPVVHGRHAHAPTVGGHVRLRAPRRVHQPRRGGVRPDGRLSAPAGHSRGSWQGAAAARVVRAARRLRQTRTGCGRRGTENRSADNAQRNGGRSPGGLFFVTVLGRTVRSERRRRQWRAERRTAPRQKGSQQGLGG